MRLIDADELKQQIAVWQRIDPYNTLSMAAGAFICEVDKSPTVDAVPVVRCKDCKYMHMETEFCKSCIEVKMRGIWFCADGDRRGGND